MYRFGVTTSWAFLQKFGGEVYVIKKNCDGDIIYISHPVTQYVVSHQCYFPL